MGESAERMIPMLKYGHFRIHILKLVRKKAVAITKNLKKVSFLFYQPKIIKKKIMYFLWPNVSK